MIKGRGSSFGTPLYPSPQADKAGSRVGSTPCRRCIQCGQMNDTRKTAWSDSSDADGGCRFCGSLYWQNTKPEALPDDRNLPGERKGRRRK